MIDPKALRKMKTGDLVDAIHDSVCGLGADGSDIFDEDLSDLFILVDELRRRSLVARQPDNKLHS